MEALLHKLRLETVNLGTCCGRDRWPLETQADPLISYNPTTGKPIAGVIPASLDSYEHIVETAQNAFYTWREMPAPRRGLVIRDLGLALREYLEPLGELISLEMGKIRAEGIGEVQEMIDICDFAVGLSRQLYGLTMTSERPRHRMMEQWHPLGPVAVITAFNFPVAVWSWNAAIAAVCGNTLIWKPSELTPLTAIAVQHICNDVMADHGLYGIFNLLNGGPQMGQQLTLDTRIPLVSFTGSIPTGRQVAQTVSARLGRSLLELGGNNAIIVAPDADLDLATRAIVFGAVGTAGQRCTTTRRLIVHRSIAAPLTKRLKQAYQQINMGDPLRENTLMGPLVTATAVNKMEQAITQAITEGGELISGGRTRPDLGPQFVEPTLIKMPAQTAIVKEETFAPLLYLLEYETMAEAIALHNDVPQGLSSAIFTDSLRTAEAFLSVAGSDCGIANVNIGTSGAEIGGAFGGEKETGGGRESGSDAWKTYMRRQTNTINWSKDLPLAQGIKFGD
ncbi:MAG: aldehyde dehydrogenase family protein [Chloroflexi bacterium]|nr:aldehyde dehydrogenase family protein [Chloroflexota bacterium]MBP8059569.1 aldehyde dehydrogenase family protein [Chloroflexota bacterium]